MAGRCCGGAMEYWGCPGFVGGPTAISQLDNGNFYPETTTHWKRGTNQGIPLGGVYQRITSILQNYCTNILSNTRNR